MQTIEQHKPNKHNIQSGQRHYKTMKTMQQHLPYKQTTGKQYTTYKNNTKQWKPYNSTTITHKLHTNNIKSIYK